VCSAKTCKNAPKVEAPSELRDKEFADIVKEERALEPQPPGREQQLSGSSAASRDNTGIDANRGSIQRLGELRGWQVVTDLHEQRR
jgi:hypothetical protein